MPFQARFQTAEIDFLAALVSGNAALEAFYTEWDALCADAENARQHGSLNDDEIQMIIAITSRVAILGESFLELTTESEAVTATYLKNVEVALAALSLSDTDSTPRIPRGRSTLRPLPPFISSAFSWLSDNLHDPYPPSSLKRSWARSVGISVRVMDDWFKSIRKVIGWVSFTKTHFNGSRSFAVSAAQSVFGNEAGPACDPTITPEVLNDLVAIKSKLDSLYLSERGLEPSQSNAQLTENGRLRSISPASTTSSIINLNVMTPALPLDESIVPYSATSTPGKSPFMSHLPSLVFDPSDSEDEDRSLPEHPTGYVPGIASGFLTVCAKDLSDDCDRRLKRTRHSYFDIATADSLELCSTDLSIPLLEVSRQMDPHCGISAPRVSASIAEPPCESVPLQSRKRRRSDADSQPALKKPRTYSNLSRPRVSRLQAVSAPLPVPQMQASVQSTKDLCDLERIFKDLERGSCEPLSPSQSARVLDTSTHVECELSNYPALDSLSSSDNPGCTFDMPVIAIENVSWDHIAEIAAAAPSTDVAPLQDKELEELFASFTSSSSQTEPLFADLGSNDFGLPSTLVLETQNATKLSAASLGDLSLPGEYAPAQPQDSFLWEDLFGFLDADETLSGEVTIFGEPSASPSTGNPEHLTPLVNIS